MSTKTVSINGLKDAHAFVREQRAAGNDVRWDGWDMVFWRPAPYAVEHKAGARRRGRWGFESRVVVNSKGDWNIDERNVRTPRSVRARA